jgi:hypothetical protein
VIIPPPPLLGQEEKVSTENIAGNGGRRITGAYSWVVIPIIPWVIILSYF